jgi:hypothetical protein
VTTQLLVTSTPAEALLAAAAAQAGLLDPPDRLVPVSPADDPDAVAARVGHDVELVVGTSTLAAGRALSRQGRQGIREGPRWVGHDRSSGVHLRGSIRTTDLRTFHISRRAAGRRRGACTRSRQPSTGL